MNKEDELIVSAMLLSLFCIIPLPIDISVENAVLPFVLAFESFIGMFLFGYLSYSVVKNTLRNWWKNYEVLVMML